MVQVVILGYGNVGQQLCKTLHEVNEVSVIQVFSRNKNLIPTEVNNIPIVYELLEIKEADIYIIAIPDDAIPPFSEKLPFQNKLVIHTSGGLDIKKLSDKNRRGVFYPLQTFSKNRNLNFKEIPICIEAENDSDLKILQQLGDKISEKVIEINSEKRAKLHLAAVFVNNFVNHLYSIGNDILETNDLSFDLLRSLIMETGRKIKTLHPNQVQTGPAKRNDLKTIEKHLHLLEDEDHKKIYKQLTESIQNIHGKKL